MTATTFETWFEEWAERLGEAVTLVSKAAAAMAATPQRARTAKKYLERAAILCGEGATGVDRWIQPKGTK
jgi:hypothetical protein